MVSITSRKSKTIGLRGIHYSPTTYFERRFVVSQHTSIDPWYELSILIISAAGLRCSAAGLVELDKFRKADDPTPALGDQMTAS